MSSLKFKVQFNNCMYSRDIKLSDNEYKALKNSMKISICKSTGDLILDDDYFDESSLVNDEARYTIEIINNKCTKPKLLKDFKPIKGNENIILLLESPHRSEYRSIKIYDRLVPIGPAQGGKTTDAGGAIREYIDEAINYIIKNENLNLNGNYNLIIINPIQFQASLGSLYTGGLKVGLRDKVWKDIWDISSNNAYIIKENFICRLRKYTPKLIINACTNNLKVDVENLLNIKGFISYRIKHPARNWYYGKF